MLQFYAAFKQDGKIYIITEYVLGFDLRRLMFSFPSARIPEQMCVDLIVRPLLQGVLYLHNCGIMHRDLKPDNIMLDATSDNLKIIDFGLAINFHTEMASTRAGTLEYMAPEALMCKSKTKEFESRDSRCDLDNKDNEESPRQSRQSGDHRRYGCSVDTWSIGILTYELLVGFTPFRAETNEQCVEKIGKGIIGLPKYLTDEAKLFIMELLVWDYENRPQISHFVDHAWLARHKPTSTKDLCAKYRVV